MSEGNTSSLGDNIKKEKLNIFSDKSFYNDREEDRKDKTLNEKLRIRRELFYIIVAFTAICFVMSFIFSSYQGFLGGLTGAGFGYIGASYVDLNRPME